MFSRSLAVDALSPFDIMTVNHLEGEQVWLKGKNAERTVAQKADGLLVALCPGDQVLVYLGEANYVIQVLCASEPHRKIDLTDASIRAQRLSIITDDTLSFRAAKLNTNAERISTECEHLYQSIEQVLHTRCENQLTLVRGLSSHHAKQEFERSTQKSIHTERFLVNS